MPQGLDLSALTTTSASTASSTTMMPSTATSAVMPAIGPISSRAICAERLAVRGGADEQRIDEVLHRAAERDADDDPDDARQIAELRRERGSDERPRPGDRREMMSEHDPSVRRDEIATVVEPHGWRRAARVEGEDLRGDQFAVEAVRDRVHADARR